MRQVGYLQRSNTLYRMTKFLVQIVRFLQRSTAVKGIINETGRQKSLKEEDCVYIG